MASRFVRSFKQWPYEVSLKASFFLGFTKRDKSITLFVSVPLFEGGPRPLSDQILHELGCTFVSEVYPRHFFSLRLFPSLWASSRRMCRWITIISSEAVSLSDVILAPSQSLVQMSRDASFHPGAADLNNSLMNGDGFGVGWYHNNVAIVRDKQYSADGGKDASSPTNVVMELPKSLPTRAAAIYKDVFPAWNNINLKEICMSTSSDCIVAHVRAASAGSGINFTNCHPFKAGRLIFCHNGRLERFQSWRRRLLDLVDDEAFALVKGTTDSECIFALILTYLARDGSGAGMSPIHQRTGFGEMRLMNAVKAVIRQIHQVFATVDIEGYNTCNFCLTDGNTVVVTRYCDQAPDVPPPSLYFAFGHAHQLHQELTNEPVQTATLFFKQESNVGSSMHGSSVEADGVDSSNDDDSTEEREILLSDKQSKPGTVMKEVNPKEASFIVSSNPLTKTHTWHKLPQNSIMWCTRGENPELRLLKRKSGSSQIIHTLK